MPITDQLFLQVKQVVAYAVAYAHSYLTELELFDHFSNQVHLLIKELLRNSHVAIKKCI